MVSRFWLRTAAAVVLATGAACGQQLQVQPPIVTPAAVAEVAEPVPLPPAPPEDPVYGLIAESKRLFEAGQVEVELGHLERARSLFNQALNLLLQWPGGPRTDARLRNQFDRLVDRISTYEVSALRLGDAFTEKSYEAASIDEMLALSTFDTPLPSPQLERSVANDLESTAHDIPIPLNDRVLSYVELFSGKLKSYIQQGLQRGARYLPMIQSVFRAEGLPLDLAYVPLIESAFKPNAVSRAKAKGVWQFMRATALEHGLKQDWYIDERSDPEKATRAAAAYLRTLYEMFDGNWHLALASYNSGPGRVQQAVRRSGGITDYWRLRTRTVLPRETREYVPMILAAIIVARNPTRYGLEVPPADCLAYEQVPLKGPVDLRLIAEWAGVPVTQIEELNPELRRWTTPVKYDGVYELKVPPGTATSIERRLAEADPAELVSLRWHTVKRGETLVSIARALSVSRTDLAEANNLPRTARLSPGQRLIVPREPTALLAANADLPEPQVARPVAASRPVSATTVASAPEARESDEVRLIYRVKKGDTLSSIARLFRTTVASLKSWNRLTSNRINIGDRLTILRPLRGM
ncbi:MAG: LysM peptidoglycan-binding domain-containing protein [Vicinamibacterales bacterium]